MYNGAIDCVRRILKEEGFWALYKGSLSPLIGVGSITAIQFFTYQKIKHFLDVRIPNFFRIFKKNIPFFNTEIELRRNRRRRQQILHKRGHRRNSKHTNSDSCWAPPYPHASGRHQKREALQRVYRRRAQNLQMARVQRSTKRRNSLFG